MNLVFMKLLRRFEQVATHIASSFYSPLSAVRGRSIFWRRDGDTVGFIAAVLGVLKQCKVNDTRELHSVFLYKIAYLDEP